MYESQNNKHAQAPEPLETDQIGGTRTQDQKNHKTSATKRRLRQFQGNTGQNSPRLFTALTTTVRGTNGFCQRGKEGGEGPPWMIPKHSTQGGGGIEHKKGKSKNQIRDVPEMARKHLSRFHSNAMETQKGR